MYRLLPYKVSKGIIRFPLSEPVPLKLIERIAKLFDAFDPAVIEQALQRAVQSARAEQHAAATHGFNVFQD